MLCCTCVAQFKVDARTLIQYLISGVSKLCCGASDVLSVINETPCLSANAKIDILQTSLGVRGQLEHPPLSYKRSLITTPATGGNQRRVHT